MADFKVEERVESTGVIVNKVATAPDAHQDKSILYNMTPDSGGTGLYFKTANSTVTESEELISKKKAVTFSIIF